MRTERGWQHTTHGLSSPSYHPAEADPAAAGHRASLGVGPLQCHQELPLEHQCSSHMGMTNHLDTFASLGEPHMTSSACVCRSWSKTLAAPESSRATHLCFVVSVLRKHLTTLSKQSHWTKMQTTSRTGGLLKNAFHSWKRRGLGSGLL